MANLPFRYANQDVEIDGGTVHRGDAVPWRESGRNAIGRSADRFYVTYVRQSSAHQVLHNRGSSALQYAMRDRLATLGWSDIETVDDDLGRSGAGGVIRAGFDRMVVEVCLGKVGAVAAGGIALRPKQPGGVHTEQRLQKRRRGQRNATPHDIIEVVRQLVLIANDDMIAGVLNRNGLMTGNGNRWIRERVTALRSYRKIPVLRPQIDGVEAWLNLGGAADFTRPGKPADNAFIEAFNGRFRAECLNQHWFLTLADARQKMEDWRRYYNPVHNAPLSMLLKGISFLDLEAILWDVDGYAERARGSGCFRGCKF